MAMPALAARTPGGALRVETVSDARSFLEMEPEWNRLVDTSACPHPFLRHEWARCWWESFGSGRQLHVLTVKDGDEPVAIAPLMASHGRLYGMSVRRLELMHNDHSPRLDLIAGSRHEEACRALWSELAPRRELWNVLQLPALPVGSPTIELLSELARADGFLLGVWPGERAPYVSLGGSWDRYFGALKPKHRSNVRNRTRRLEQLGRVELDVVCTPDPEALDDGFRIEAAAWKGRAGTAILCRRDTEEFYRRVAIRAAERGWLRLHFLRVGGRRVAFEYGLQYARRLYILKLGYDPEYARYAPQHLLSGLVIRDAIERGLSEYDFLGDGDTWKQDWADGLRQHCWLYILRPELHLRLAHGLKFRLLPELRRTRVYAGLRQLLFGGR